MPELDPYVAVCRDLEEAGVRYLIVGTTGLNLFGGSKGPWIYTLDCDLFLPPDPDQLAKAVALIRGQGYTIEAGREPLPDEDPVVIRGIVRARACVRAHRERDESRIDLPLEIAGADFADLWSRRTEFAVQGVTVHVAPLLDIIRSKQLANRPKDRAVLESFRAELEDLVGGPLPEVDPD